MRTLQPVPIAILLLALSAGALGGREQEAPPTLPQLAELTASDGTSVDAFGSSVAISGNTVVVGAPEAQIGSNQSEGAAYVFVKPSSGWSNMMQVAKLTPSAGSAYFRFGFSVAISGNTIVVGTDPVNGGGFAFVFVMPTGGWKDMTETAELTGSNVFSSVAISGNVVVAGASAAQVGSNFAQGAGYVYVKPKTGWASTAAYAAELTASDGTYQSGLGTSVAISSNTVVAGAYSAAVGSTDQGAAYVFVRPASGWATATETAKLTASDGQYEDSFGQAVGISGTTIVAGAPRHAVGAEYVFVRPANGWTSATQTAELTGGGCEFGWSVAISPMVAIAGEEECPQGAAYGYKMPQTGWITTSKFNIKLTAHDGFAGDQFGTSVSISGATIVVGATKLGVSPGAVYVF